LLSRVINNKSHYNLDNKNMLRKVTVKIRLNFRIFKEVED